MMDSENLFLNRSELNVEKLVRAKKIAKIMIIWTLLMGVAMGVSASLVFFFHYKLLVTSAFALLSSFIAALVIYVHYQFLCDHWQIWTYQLKYWYRAAFVAQLLFATIVAMLIVVGIYLKQHVDVHSYFVMAVWAFMCWKWSFALYYRSHHFRTMFTRYSLIGADEQIATFE